MVKLHLGCGERYLPGYVNVDYPASMHTVQKKQKVELYADIKRLHFKEGTIEEVRSHHVFEHFDRVTAIRLLIDWHRWLKDGGILVIETPDFLRSIRAFGLMGSYESQAKALRHIFGTHEASWAYHCDGWYRKKFDLYLTTLGYGDLKYDFSEWQGTYNITVTARNKSGLRTEHELLECAKKLLKYNLIDDSEIEARLLDVWMGDLEQQLKGLK